MKRRNVMIALALLDVLVASLTPACARAQPASPPYAYPGEVAGFSVSEFQRVLSQLKSEREGLDTDWRSLTKRLNRRPPSTEPDLGKLQEQLKQALIRLQQERMKLKTVSPEHPTPGSTEPPMPVVKKSPDAEPRPAGVGALAMNPELGAVDVVHLAQTLFRAERYEEALAAFRQVDLKGKKADERVPIVYLTANCLHQVGKTDEGIALLRDAANSRGDERFAGYAQWQLENLRWHRESQGRLEEIRQRRLGTENR